MLTLENQAPQLRISAFSADSHVIEPREIFEATGRDLGDRAPRFIEGHDGAMGTFIEFPDGFTIAVGRLGLAGEELNTPATTARIARGYDGLNPGTMDPGQRLAEQDADGVIGEVLFPSFHLHTFSLPDRDVVHRLFRSYNDWLIDYCATSPERLLPVACIPLPDIAESVAELERTAARGARGVLIPCAPPPELPYSDRAYDVFWQAAQAAGLPIAMHTGSGATPDHGLPAHWGNISHNILARSLAHCVIASAISHLICGGVAQRYPGLRWVSAEFETGWLAHFLHRLDSAAYRFPTDLSPDLDRRPSEYFAGQFYATFEDDEIGIRTRDIIGPENLMWGNDYPHADSVWPHSQDTLLGLFDGIPERERELMVRSNVARLYGLNP